MSEAPERIWAWWDDAYDVGLLNEHGDKRYTPNDAKEYVRADRIEELENERDEALNQLDSARHSVDVLEKRVAFVENERRKTFQALLKVTKIHDEVEAKLAKAMEALDEAVYLLAPDEKDMVRQAGVYRIVTTLAELKGEQDG